MERIYRFDEDFFRKKINEVENVLKNGSIDEETKIKIDSMLINFYDYLDDNRFSPSNKKPNLSLDEIYQSLTNKFNRDLNRLSLEHWKSIHDLCWRCEKPSFPTSNTHKLSLSDDAIVNNALRFYRNLDKEFYYTAKRIIDNPIPLINFTNRKSLGDHCFPCYYLDLPFINVCRENDLLMIWFVHELQHGIDFLLYKEVPYLFSETSSMFCETLYIDSLTTKNLKTVDSKKFYSYRIHANNENMQHMYKYIELLYQFIENGLEVNKGNIGKILSCDTEKDVIDKYKNLKDRNYLEMFEYILSFFRSLELREIYYNDSKTALSQLKNILMGGNDTVDFDVIEDSYSNYVKEIKGKYKSKVR